MNRLPDDLVLYLRTKRLGQNQKKLIRELASEYAQRRVPVADYARRFADRALRISKALDGSLISRETDAADWKI